MTTKNQKGFTLVEIAIVLVIIGLLLGGVLKGQELIENTKIKSVVNEVNAYQAAIFGYQDRYNSLPGDDGPQAKIDARGGDWVGLTPVGDGDGSIENNNNERFGMFLHLATAGFIKSFEGIGTAYPTHKYGGQIQPTQNASGNNFRLGLCYTGLTQETAEALDRAVDGTVDPAAGNVRRSNQAAYAGNDTVCFKVL